MKNSVWFISSIVTLLLCTSPAVANQANPPVTVTQPEWQQVTSTDGNYTVLMPNKAPTEKKSFLDTKAGRIELKDAIVNLKTELYGVSYGEYPDSQAPPAKALDDIRSVVLTVIPGKLLKEQNLELDGYSGKEIEIESAEGTSSAIVRIYLVQQRLYLVAVATKEKKEGFSQGAARFFNSFHLVVSKSPSTETKPPADHPTKPDGSNTSVRKFTSLGKCG